jgi:hypothetical protein
VIADSIFLNTEFPKVFALLFRRLRLNDFLEARIAAERVPEAEHFYGAAAGTLGHAFA